jgi:hypothetical protein
MPVTLKPEAVNEYARLLLRMHELDPQGKNESPELDAICDQLEGPWSKMNGRERQRVKGLSQDLYALADGRRGVAMSVEERHAWGERAKVAFNSGDPDAMLMHLRQPFPQGVPLGLTQFFQARCWEGWENLDVALTFMREAVNTVPAAGMTLMNYLERLQRNEEAAQLADRIVANPKSSLLDVYLAAAGP